MYKWGSYFGLAPYFVYNLLPSFMGEHKGSPLLFFLQDQSLYSGRQRNEVR